MSDFFHMGGYAFYVWVSYGITFAVLLWNILQPCIQHRSQLRRLAMQQRRDAADKRNAP